MKTFKQMCSEVADHIEKVGWIQGRRYEDWDNRNNSPCCILGAAEVVGDYDELDNFCKDFYAVMGVAYVTEWNDAPGRTKEEVIAKLRELATK